MRKPKHRAERQPIEPRPEPAAAAAEPYARALTCEDCPSRLSLAAKEYWIDAVSSANLPGAPPKYLLTDRAALARYCVLHAAFDGAIVEIADSGVTIVGEAGPSINPLLVAALRLDVRLGKHEGDFGRNPKERPRVERSRRIAAAEHGDPPRVEEPTQAAPIPSKLRRLKLLG